MERRAMRKAATKLTRSGSTLAWSAASHISVRIAQTALADVVGEPWAANHHHPFEAGDRSSDRGVIALRILQPAPPRIHARRPGHQTTRMRRPLRRHTKPLGDGRGHCWLPARNISSSLALIKKFSQ